jgi:hypothetical protein
MKLPTKTGIVSIVMLGLACNAQTPVLPIFDNPDFGEAAGVSYKDINNDFDNFTGTWEFVSGTTSLRIVLQKQLQAYSDVNDYFQDVMYGEYRFIENSVEKVNTLNQVNFGTPFSHAIAGNLIIKSTGVPICNNCTPDEKRLNLMFKDPTRSNIEGLSGEIIVKRSDVGATQKITITLKQEGNIIYDEGAMPQYTSLSLPWGTYTLTKVN